MNDNTQKRVLILRTFAHTRVWDDRDVCSYEGDQASQIHEWEPNYRDVKRNDIHFALGIYTEKYFTYVPRYGNKGPVYLGTDEEQIPSIIQLKSGEDQPTLVREDWSLVAFRYKVEQKLWSEPNTILMSKLDNLLVQQKVRDIKQAGIKVNTIDPYKPLSFTLSHEKVLGIMNELGIDLS
jgi:hypothetical protein